MRRVASFVLRNWPLKLGAVLLATLLYSGLVLSQNVRTFSGEVPVDPIRQSPETTLLAEIEPVTEVRYRAPLDVGILSPDSFRATVDLSRIQAQPGGEAQDLPVSLIAVDRRVQIVDFTPNTVQVRLDSVDERTMPVTVVLGPVPEGVTVGPPQTDPSQVRIRGASSRVSTVRQVVARVNIDAAALNVDRDVELVPIDDQGNQVPSVDVDPPRARVRIAVAFELANRTLPVVPQLVGELAAGYQLTAVDVSPLTVNVAGSESVVARLDSVPTQPIDITGRTTDLAATVGLALPPEVSVVGSEQVAVRVAISEVLGTRTFSAGVNLVDVQAELTYQPVTTQVAVVLGGPLAQLDAINAAQLVVDLQVTDLGPGEHLIPVVFTPPTGVELVSLSPPEVLVRVEQPPADEGAGPPAEGAGGSLIGRV